MLLWYPGVSLFHISACVGKWWTVKDLSPVICCQSLLVFPLLSVTCTISVYVHSCDELLFLWISSLRFFRLVMTDGFAFWLFTCCSVTRAEEGLSGTDTVLTQAWSCFSEGTVQGFQEAGQVEGGWLDICFWPSAQAEDHEYEAQHTNLLEK